MDSKTLILTMFLFGCITAVALYGIYEVTHMQIPLSPKEIIQMYFAGGFGVVTGGTAGIAIGKAIEKKKKGGTDETIEETYE